MTPLIQIEGLVKTFGQVRALDGLDLQVAEGEVQASSGPTARGRAPRSGSCSG